MGAPAHKSFDSVEAKEPSCSFDLGGRTWHCRNRDDVPFPAIEGLLAAQQSGKDDAVAVQVLPLFRALIVPKEVKAFTDMIEADDSPLTLGMLGPVLEWIAEQVLNRPTKRPKPSPAGSRKTGEATSKAG